MLGLMSSPIFWDVDLRLQDSDLRSMELDLTSSGIETSQVNKSGLELVFQKIHSIFNFSHQNGI
jgi:hypothetical protein